MEKFQFWAIFPIFRLFFPVFWRRSKFIVVLFFPIPRVLTFCSWAMPHAQMPLTRYGIDRNAESPWGLADPCAIQATGHRMLTFQPNSRGAHEHIGYLESQPSMTTQAPPLTTDHCETNFLRSVFLGNSMTALGPQTDGKTDFFIELRTKGASFISTTILDWLCQRDF